MLEPPKGLRTTKRNEGHSHSRRDGHGEGEGEGGCSSRDSCARAKSAQHILDLDHPRGDNGARGLDAAPEDGEHAAERRSMLYRAMTRAQLAVAVVNQALPGGWLEFLGRVGGGGHGHDAARSAIAVTIAVTVPVMVIAPIIAAMAPAVAVPTVSAAALALLAAACSAAKCARLLRGIGCD